MELSAAVGYTTQRQYFLENGAQKGGAVGSSG